MHTGALPHNAEPTMNMAMLEYSITYNRAGISRRQLSAKGRTLLPTRSEKRPYNGWNAVCVRRYAMPTHAYWSSDACKSATMVGRLVETIVWEHVKFIFEGKVEDAHCIGGCKK